MEFEFIFLAMVSLLLLVVLWWIWPLIIGAVYVPTPMDVVEKMLRIADIRAGDTLIDLGSGDGRIIIEAAKNYDISSIGIEADPLRVLWSRLRINSNGLIGKAEVIWGNFFKTDLSNATVVTVYQGQEINNKLKNKFMRELDPGTRVVSYSFTFDGWEPIKKDPESNVYLYTIAVPTNIKSDSHGE